MALGENYELVYELCAELLYLVLELLFAELDPGLAFGFGAPLSGGGSLRVESGLDDCTVE